MSGVNDIIGETVRILADHPIVGPTDDQELVAVPLATGLQHMRSVTPLQFGGSQAIGPNATVTVSNVGSFIPINPPTPLFPVPVDSNLKPASTIVIDASNTIRLLDFQYGEVTFQLQWSVNMLSALAPVGPPDGTIGSWTLNVQASDDVAVVYPLLRSTNPMLAFNGLTWRYREEYTFLVPYNALRSYFQVQMSITNATTGVDNIFQLLTTSTINVIQQA